MTDAPRHDSYDKAAASEILNSPNSAGIIILPDGTVHPIPTDLDTSTWVVTHVQLERRRPENHE